MREEFEAAPRAMLTLDPAADPPAGLRHVGHGRVNPSQAGVRIRFRGFKGGEHWVVLPSLPDAGRAAQLVKLRITVPWKSTLLLSTITDRERPDRSRILFGRDVTQGENVIYPKLFPHQAGESLSLKLKGVANIQLNEFEVRSAEEK